MNPHVHGQSMTKESRMHNGVKTVSSIKGVGETGETCNIMNSDHYLTPF